MLATTGELPKGDAWAFEFKWDGIRALVEIAQGRVRVYSRNGRELTNAFPELVGLSDQAPDALLDGELVGFGEDGKPSFGRVIERMHTSDPVRVRRLIERAPVMYVIFDLLRLDHIDTRSLPYIDRRVLLEGLELSGTAWRTPPYHDDGENVMAAALANDLEGVMAKRRDSTYTSRRTREWIKVKPTRSMDVVVGGWRQRVRQVGSLLVGEPTRRGTLRFRGRVGGGISASMERTLLGLLDPLETEKSPFESPVTGEDAKGTTWVRPRVVVEVEYGTLTPEGRLCFPRLRRIRTDRCPEDL